MKDRTVSVAPRGDAAHPRGGGDAAHPRGGRVATRARPGADRADADTPPRRVAARPPGVYRRRRVVAGLVVLTLLGSLAVGVRVLLWDAGLFLVERVTVSGAAVLSPDAVLAAAAVPDAVPLVTVDTQGVADRVAALPAVASVHVGRSWPHTVTVAVVERTAVATVATPGGVQLVDAGGAVYPGPAAADLPALTMSRAGPGDPATTAALGALEALPPAVRAQVRTVGATVAGTGAPGEVTFGLSGARQILWGTLDRGTDKAAVIGPLLTQDGRVFDVSSPDLPTIRR